MTYGIETYRRMSDFEFYLRTGCYRGPNLTDTSPEQKFNPWHDPEDGRFTFRNGGRHYGPGSTFRGGGGSVGGAGATGSWDIPKPQPKPERTPNGKPDKILAQLAARTTAQSPARMPHAPRPFVPIQRNGYTYQIGVLRRPRDISGDLQNGPHERRSRRAQLQAGGTERRPTDDGGHYIARRFNGPRDAFNHFAQDRNFNRGAYREMESEWGREIASGRKVHVRIIPRYRDDSQRPSSIRVISTIGSERIIRDFPNEPSGGQHGR